MTAEKLKISPPWITYINKLTALFINDPEIRIEYNNQAKIVSLYVEEDKKASALSELLPTHKKFGNIDLWIKVIPANKFTYAGDDYADLFETAFKNNPVFAFNYTVHGIFSNKITYVVFKNRVVQFFNDNLNDLHGNISTLYQELASDVFDMNKIDGIFFCTDVEEKVGKPLGEWP